MIINRSFKEFKFRHRSKKNQIIYTSKKINNIKNQILENKSNNFNEYSLKHNMNNKRSILKSYDILLNDKYNVVLNQKTIERVKNFFQ